MEESQAIVGTGQYPGPPTFRLAGVLSLVQDVPNMTISEKYWERDDSVGRQHVQNPGEVVNVADWAFVDTMP
ncbi:hypothetical protein PG989_009957 [Apiospora arundinis]|uniref:Uncharacterized protein n=1 Tax=Apiospora arundinis TaxID=335852 RepID=A0ABR2JAE4_9PEZI